MAYAYVNMIGLGLDAIGVWLVYWYAIPSVVGWADQRQKPHRNRKLGHAGHGCLSFGFLLQALASGLSVIAAG